MDLLFCCLPDDVKCEPFILRDLLRKLIEAESGAYSRIRCLDREERNQKEPELLIDGTDVVPIVVERKSVAWPSESYYSDHRNSHALVSHFGRYVSENKDPFQNGLYKILVQERSLKKKRKQEIKRIAQAMADVVLAAVAAGEPVHGLGGNLPIWWRLREVLPSERDESMPERGIGIEVSQENVSFDLDGKVLDGYASEFERQASAAAEKFQRYRHCRRLLAIQFFGEGSCWIDDGELLSMIKSADLPEEVDEVWVAYHDWVNAYEHEIGWACVRGGG